MQTNQAVVLLQSQPQDQHTGRAASGSLPVPTGKPCPRAEGAGRLCLGCSWAPDGSSNHSYKTYCWCPPAGLCHPGLPCFPFWLSSWLSQSSLQSSMHFWFLNRIYQSPSVWWACWRARRSILAGSPSSRAAPLSCKIKFQAHLVK